MQRIPREVAPMSISKVLCAALLACIFNSSSRADVPQNTRHVVYQKSGDAYRLAVVTVPTPKPGAHQVLVHMRAISLNRGEIENLDAAKSNREGMIAASDGAGEVAALGANAKQFKVGDRVSSMYWRNYDHLPASRENFEGALGSSIDGVFGDYVVVDESALVPIPAGWSDVDAATLPTAGLTAYNAVIVEGHAAPGKTVLVQGTGGVSTFALLLAHAAGATVIVTSSSDEKLEKARALGATQGINYKSMPEWGKKVVELTNGHGADVVVEVGGKGTLAQSLDAVAIGGTISIIGGITGYGGDLQTMPLIDKAAHVAGISVGSRRQLRELQSFMTKHEVKPLVEHVYPVEQLDAAIEQLRSGQFMGKIVVTLAEPHR
jgi:NADPH:quinone reductase-like Zn-dependent oxidoreductase